MLRKQIKNLKEKSLAVRLMALLISGIMVFTMQGFIVFAQTDSDNRMQQSSLSDNALHGERIEKSEPIDVQQLNNNRVQIEKSESDMTTINIEENAKPESKMRVYASDGTKSYNVNAHHYETMSQTVNSYIFENIDGGLIRAEYVGSEFIVEKYDDAYNLKNKITLTFASNTVFGGFYHGEKYNYIMLGHTDADEEKNIPQYELQIYDSTFSFIDTISINGINSNNKELPFGITNVRFEELGELLYVRTGHILGKTDAQAGHQETLYFIFDTSKKILLYVDDTYDGVTYGDVGHTLNRFLGISDSRLYVAEQQDFNPGAVFLFELPLYQSTKEKIEYTTAADFSVNSGTSVVINVDGTIGGMEFAENNLLIAGSYKNNGSNEWEKNVFVSVMPINGNALTSKIIYLTDYEVGSRIVATTPQLIKVSDNRFLVLWTNYYIPDKEGQIYYSDCENDTCYLFIDGEGNILTDVIKIDASMSDCQPILHNGNVVWYYTNDSAPMFIQIPADGTIPVWNPTGADYYEVVVNYPENSQSFSYAYDSEVTLTPKNISGKYFDHWELVSGNIVIAEPNEKNLTFKMPVGEVIVTAIYGEETDDSDIKENKEQYNVSFYNKSGETGDGNYEPGEIVTISANTTTEGKRFREWRSVYGNWNGFQSKTSPVTTFTMPEFDVLIQPLYEYGRKVIVENGSGDGIYFEGDIVKIIADEIEGKTFSHWYFRDIDGGNTLAYAQDEYAPVTSFEMVDGSVLVRAVYNSDTSSNNNKNNEDIGGTNENTNSNIDGEINNQAGVEQNDDLLPVNDIKVASLSITAPSKKLATGKIVKLNVEVTPFNATNGAVVWKTSNDKYALIDNNGKLTLKKAGAGKTVTITAKTTDGSGKKATIKIKIMKHAVKSIKIKAPSKTLKAGKSMKLETIIKTTGKKANKTLKWSSSNTKYATVSKSGKVKAKKAGKGKTVTITAKATDGSNKKAKVKIKIK